MIKRKIIKIDESKCDGCALCIPSCPEGALQIIDGKAKLVKESFCDGLGACLGDCLQDALHVMEAIVDEYDEVSVIEHIKKNTPDKLETHIRHLQKHSHELKISAQQTAFSSCPSARVIQFEAKQSVNSNTGFESQLGQWPIQLHLVPTAAPCFQNADFVLVADCVPFAYANFHSGFLNGNAIAIACPKLDNISPYVDKLTNIFRASNLKSIKVVVMEVPCCSGLVRIAKEAANYAAFEGPLEIVTVGIKGNILEIKILHN
jgi:Pyruvate/2-oxoacid:ferredoxin oxidoreductase delta subunit